MSTANKSLITILLSLLITAPVFADYSSKHGVRESDRELVIEHRLERLIYQIEVGIDHDSLTLKEKEKLMEEHHTIYGLSREYRKDRYLSHNEFKRLMRKLDRLSGLIWEYKHNDLVRYVIFHDRYAQKHDL